MKVSEVKTKKIDEFDAKPEKEKYLDLKSVYGHLSTKQSMLMKTFAANYNKLLKQMISQANKTKGENTFFQQFFVNGKSVVKCCLPFKIYSRKLSNNMASLCMQYSKIDPTS